MGLKVSRGTIQAATFIKADSGKSKRRSKRLPKLAMAEMELGRKKRRKAILTASFPKKPNC